jgi:hydroxymethylglutaryl-CoA lyase
LPQRVTIYEVGARDGLQNEDVSVSVEVKAEFIARLAAAGLGTIEATSMVRPSWVPQLADAEELLDRLDLASEIRYPVLVPNERGLERALAHGVREVAVFASATETFARKNLNRSLAESMAMIGPVVTGAVAAGLTVRGYVSMCFGDPWEGAVPVGQVVDVGTELLELGCDELSLGDTIGVGTAGQVTGLLGAFEAAGVGPDRLAMHFHDTYGQSLANIMAVMERGIAVFDTAVAGLGGCPYAKGASGNVGTEDVIYLMNGLGIEHGVDLDAIARAGRDICVALGREPASKVAQALKAKAM